MKTLAILLVVPLLICGCTKDAKTKKKSKKTSAAQSMIEGMTGHTAVKSGHRAASDVKKVSAAHQKDLDDILGK